MLPDRCSTVSSTAGMVYIVGAGPGAADLLTLRALEQVFDHRIAICPLAGQWLALPNIYSWKDR